MEIAANKNAQSRSKTNGTTVNGRAYGHKAQMRTRVTNGIDVLPNVDNRSMIARRYFDIQTAIIAEQGSDVSETRLQLIRRFAAAAVLAEQMEADLANGKNININEHALLCSSLVRVANKIGINRIPKDVTDNIDPLEYARTFEHTARDTR
jgi:hypothetical protein